MEHRIHKTVVKTVLIWILILSNNPIFSEQEEVLPPTIIKYLEGVPGEATQFGFMLGDWASEITVYSPDGSVVTQVEGKRTGKFLFNKRMFMDELVTYSKQTGRELTSTVNLRSFNPHDKQWEVVFLDANQAQTVNRFTGTKVGDEIHLSELSDNVTAKLRYFDITQNSFSWEMMVTQDGQDWWRQYSGKEIKENKDR